MRHKPVIAVVDDDQAIRDALSDLIEVLDMSCQTFSEADTLLSDHAQGLFDCVITDLRMPGTSGLDLQERLQVLDPGLPVIIMTSCEDAVSRGRALRNGALAFLTKPVRGEDLIHHLVIARRGQGAAVSGS